MQDAGSSIMEDNIVLIDGRLSIREDDEAKIVANNVVDINQVINSMAGNENEVKKPRILSLEITNLSEQQKEKLRGAIKFFAGDKNNILVQVIDNGLAKPCGGIYLNEEILKEFEDIVGKDKVHI